MRSKGGIAPLLTELGRVPAPDLGDTGQLQRLDIAADGAPRLRRILDEQAEARAPRQGFKPERAGAREQVEHPGALEIEARRAMLQHVEQRLAHAVGCRPCGKPFRRLDACAPEFAGYDAHGRAKLIERARRVAFRPRCRAPARRRASRPSWSRSTRGFTSLTVPGARSPRANGPKEMRISRLTVRPSDSASRFTSRFLPSRSPRFSHILVPCSRSMVASTGP